MNKIIFIYVSFYSIFFEIPTVKSDVNLLINLWNFTNPNGHLANADCCDNFQSFQCNSQCYVRTKICIDYTSSNPELVDFTNCPLGSILIYPQGYQNTFNYVNNLQTATPYTFTFAWTFNSAPQVRIKIYTDDLRGISNTNDIVFSRLIDYYFVDFNINSQYIPATGANSAQWVQYPNVAGTLQQTFISFQAALKCTANYYSQSCNSVSVCMPKNDCTGHYTCDRNGNIICDYGFYDASTFCVKPNTSISVCNPTNYCKNGGICYQQNFDVINGNFPICCCPTGLGGLTCSNIISCLNNICQNNGICSMNYATGYGSCQCQPGFTGQFCETALNCSKNYYGDDCTAYCVATNTCQEHTQCNYFGNLTCIDGWGNFPLCNIRLISPNIDPGCPIGSSCLNGGSCWNQQCCCTSGFTGSRCESPINPCVSPSPCLNNGTCVANGLTFTCICPPGFSGSNCQVSINPCLNETLCSSNGVCTPNSNFTDYTCKCNIGFTGSNCNKKIDYCSSLPCLNNATCYTFTSNYACNCQSGFSGVNCEQKINLCNSSKPCIHGQCHNLPGSYICICDSGWKNSQTCNDDIDECATSPTPCVNGICINSPGNFSCSCLSGYTGKYCEQVIQACASNPCNSNNTASCSNQINNYICICLPGFTGPTCNIQNDNCVSNPCLNNATCTNMVNAYSCNCAVGYTGSKCDQQINLCAQNPCVTGQYSKCIPYLNSYVCVCIPGYYGINCQSQIDECLSNPCKSNATCIDQVNSYTCNCPTGFTSSDCSISSNPCINSSLSAGPCGLNGQCYPVYSTQITYYCSCNAGYQGTNCENLISQCNLNKPCLNNATCIDSVNNYTCVCAPGYQGRNCLNQILTCTSNPCINGVCLNGINSYSCACNSGFSGINCDLRINVCASNPCLNEGQCIISSNDPSAYICNCTANYGGSNCQILINPCSVNPCISGQGFCQIIVNSGTYSYQCNCVTGYSGPKCERIINNCQPNPCKNLATCENQIGFYKCNCQANYYGINCENFYLCSQSPCNSTGTYGCIDTLNNFTCTCIAGYTGALCNTVINQCASNPCLNNGTCNSIVNGYICICPNYYSGKQCESQVNYCQPNPCHGSSTCVSSLGSFTCNCPIEYTGTLCNQLKDACAALPCNNGGTCINLITDYSCSCIPGYTDKKCSTQINNCASNPCQSNSTCIQVLNGYYCTCYPGYTGLNCGTLINNCETINTCLNGGNCINQINSYSCNCPIGYTGSRCESTVNLCLLSNFTCRNNGLCLISANQTLFCSCPNGFTGTRCETQINQCASTPCLNGAQCINLVNGYICNCVTDFTGTNCQSKINNCLSMPCRNGGICTDQIGSFLCTCLTGYTGIICQSVTNYCLANNCSFGTCLNQQNGYTCQCYTGYTGPSCASDINECESSGLCLNNGTCINTPGSYYCLCLPGYTGISCQTLFNPCLSFPCIRGSCINLNSIYSCQCPTGFTGSLCELDINECASNICFNNATCVNTIGSYQCACKTGYTGSSCELSVDFCQSKPCNNFGLCKNIPGGYNCACLAGYTGNLCQTIIDECASLPCMNGGFCSSNVNTPNFYSCSCPIGFAGVNCEALQNPCLTLNPCSNNSTCLDVSSITKPNSFNCYCQSGFSGPTCAIQLTICDLQPNLCLNGGNCAVLSSSTYKCVCLVGYTGTKCESKLDACYNNNCMNNSTCIIQSNSTYFCACDNLHTGRYCETIFSPCTPNPCLNSGSCYHSSPSTSVCNCIVGTYGTFCENIIPVCSSSPCINGICSQQMINMFNCSCFPGYTGVNCQINIDECSSNPCKNNGTCTTPYVNMYQCTCPIGYQGINCENATNFCSSNPCYFNSTCVQSSFGFSCNCQPGYTGLQCLTQINACASSPCKNGANCIQSVNQYTCNCLSGTTGVDCQTIINQCDLNPCLNNATCVSFINAYQCNCGAGYTGRNCQSIVDYCQLLAPCRNNASCSNQPSTNSFVCNCRLGYSGQFCENIINVCSSNPCANGGVCIFQGVYSYACQCPPNWTGYNCDQAFSYCSSNPCKNGGTCQNTIGSYQCYCTPNWIGFNCEVQVVSCLPNPCNNGNCAVINGAINCTCSNGWTGQYCSNDIDECFIQNICYVNSYCINTPGSYACPCLSGFTGTNCTQMLTTTSTSISTTVVTTTSIFTTSKSTTTTTSTLQLSPGVTITPAVQFVINYPQYVVQLGTLNNVTATNFNNTYLTCISNAWSAANPPVCPSGFTIVASSIKGSTSYCYSIIRNLTTQIAASQHCTNLNSNLVSFSTVDEYLVLKTWLATQNIVSDLWTSGTFVNNDWYWDANTIVSQQLRNVANFTENPNENAIIIKINSSFSLGSALKTAYNKGFICKLQPKVLSTQSLLIGYKSSRPGLYFPPNQNAQNIIQINFDVNITVTNAENYGNIQPPAQSLYNTYCNSIISNTVLYNNFWTIDICGNYVNDNQNLNAISIALTQAWYSQITTLSCTNCLNTIVYNSALYFGANSQYITRIYYIVYASTFGQNIIFEQGSTQFQPPTASQLALVFQNKYLACPATFSVSSLFTVLFCGNIETTKYNSTQSDLLSSWSTIVNPNSQLKIAIQGQQEYVSIPDGGKVTMVLYSVTIDNTLIDLSSQYNYESVLNRLSTKRQICQNSYPYSYQFQLINTQKLCSSRITNVQNSLQSYYAAFKSISSIRASVIIPQAAIEEFIDAFGNTYYSLPIYVVLDNGVLNPTLNSDVYQLFKKYITNIEYLPGKFFTPVNSEIKLYRNALAFRFFTNGLIQKSLVTQMQAAVNEAFVNTNTVGISTSQVSILQQVEFIQSPDSTLYQQTAFISDQNGFFYDSRILTTDSFLSYLIAKVNTLSGFLVLSNGSQLQVMNQLQTAKLVRRSDLFTFYVKNNLMAISSSDILGLSSLINQAWVQFSTQNSLASQSIFALINDYRKYVDTNNLYLGVDYRVYSENQLLSKECFDMTQLALSSIGCATCSICGFQSYNFYQASNSVIDTYYSIDLVGLVNSNETQVLTWLTSSIYSAWLNEYAGILNSSFISLPILAKPFEILIGPFGAYITRVNYVIYLNGVLAINGYDNAPKWSNIQKYLQIQNQDFKVSTLYNTQLTPKSFVGSVYVNKNIKNFIRNDRYNLETLINSIQMNALNKTNSTTKVLGSEDYYDVANSKLITRIYYSFSSPQLFDQACKLQNIYFIQNNNSYSSSFNPFGNFVRLRDLNLKLSQLITNINQLTNVIQTTWFNKNSKSSALQLASIVVLITSQERYNSLNDGSVIKVKYAITINNQDISQTNYIEPTVEDFNSNFQIYNATNCYPYQSYSIYIKGSYDNIDSIISATYTVWSSLNPNINIALNFNQNFVNFYNNDPLANSNITRFNYVVLINNITDVNDLFIVEPTFQSLNQIFNSINVTICGSTCIPSQLYDIFLYSNVTSISNAQLVTGLVSAWAGQNQVIQNSNLGVAKIFPLDSNWQTPSGVQLYRLIYTFGMSVGISTRIVGTSAMPVLNGYDVSNLVSPTDSALIQQFAGMLSIYPRDNGTIYIFPSTSANQLQSTASPTSSTIGLQWWMILIIVVAVILFVILVTLAIFAVCYKRINKQNLDINSSPRHKIVTPLVSQYSDYGITSAYQPSSYLDNRPIGTISTIKSQTRSYATELDDDNQRDMRLNLPQQYEVTIH